MPNSMTYKGKLFNKWCKILLVSCVVLVLSFHLTTRHLIHRETNQITAKHNITKQVFNAPTRLPIIHQAKVLLEFNEIIQEGKVTPQGFNATTTVSIIHPQHKISLNFQGRLGNQLFMFASLLGIAKANNLEPYVRSNVEMLNYFKHKVSTYRTSFPRQFSYGEKRGCAFEEDVMKIGGSKDTILNGYFQSWKYFISIKDVIKQRLQFNDVILTKAHDQFVNVIKTVSVANPIFIGVHVRRGDMVHNLNYVKYGYINADENYLKSAFKYMRDKFHSTVFVIASDDIKWCREHIKGDDVVFLDKGRRPETDMATLTFCNHTIITTGSFGWWSAFLTGGDVVYFGGYPRPNSTLEKEFDKPSYYLPHWVKIS